jgi:hypothetical protein
MVHDFLQESGVRKKVRGLQVNTMGNSLEDECSIFLSEMGVNDTAISGGNFFYVTKEYLASVSVLGLG